MEEKDFQNRIGRVEGLVRDIETWPDPDTRAKAVELVQSLMDFHGTGLARMTDIIAEAGERGRTIFEDFARDELVGSLLLLYGLHPVELETRVIQALDKVRPSLRSHGGSVELLGITTDGVVQLRLQGSGKSCPSSSLATLKLSIEEAIYEVAPDVTAIEAEEVAAPPAPSGFVQIGRKASYG